MLEEKAKSISYKLDAFEGPLDLLLHLIEKNKIDIYDIPIVQIRNSIWNISTNWRKRI